MARFKDSQSREWDVAIDVNQLRVVRERCGFELGKLLADNFKLLDQLAEDPVLLVDVLYVMCEPQCKAAGVSDLEFGRALAGDAIGDAYDALRNAFADFCPSRRAEPLRALLAKTKELEEAARVKAMAAIEGIDVAKTLETWNRSAGNAAGSAASIPTPLG